MFARKAFYTHNTFGLFQSNSPFVNSLLNDISENFAIISIMSSRIMVFAIPLLFNILISWYLMIFC